MTKQVWGAECFFCGYCHFDFLEDFEELDRLTRDAMRRMDEFYQVCKKVTFVAATQEGWVEVKRAHKLRKR